MMNRMPMALFWLTIGLLLILGPWYSPNIPRWTILGSGINLGWGAIFLAAYNFAWWVGMHPWSAPKPKDAIAEGPPPRPRPVEYHPEFDFTKPDDAIKDASREPK